MQQSAPSQPSPSLSSFAGLLATLTSPPKPAPAEETPLWDTSALGDDVATISYERALSARARYLAANQADRMHESYSRSGTDAGPAPVRDPVKFEVPAPSITVASALSPAAESVPDSDLRTASVTIRLSKAECAQLHRRAAEAGMTVSAYLRSCTFEAEALRAQVKQALAEIRKASESAPQVEPVPQRGRQWFRRFLKRNR